MPASTEQTLCASPELTRPRGSQASSTRGRGGLRLSLCGAMHERSTDLHTRPTSRCGYGEDRGGRRWTSKNSKGQGAFYRVQGLSSHLLIVEGPVRAESGRPSERQPAALRRASRRCPEAGLSPGRKQEAPGPWGATWPLVSPVAKWSPFGDPGLRSSGSYQEPRSFLEAERSSPCLSHH